MWRFRASKYKNAVPKVPKREEWIGDLPVSAGYQSCGNHIKASATYMAFNVDRNGSLGVLPIDSQGRQEPSMPLLCGHSEFVTDFDFSPHDDSLLCTGSQDFTVRLWRIPEGGLTEHLCTSEAVVTKEERRIENVLWNPTAEAILAATSYKTLKVYDVITQSTAYVGSPHGDQIQSVSWHGNGRKLVTSCKDKKLRVIDPRANAVVQEAEGHANLRDSRVIWLGDTDHLLSTGFDVMRTREVRMWDSRNLGNCLKSMSFDNSTGTLIPLFDPDTNMLFILGKGDTCVRFLEVTEKDPFLTEASMDSIEQVKGVGLVPKQALDVMNAEVNRILLLTKSAVIPIPYQVPRKSYSDYHADLYPETYCRSPGMTAQQWLQGENLMPSKMTLDPRRKSSSTQSKKTNIAAAPTPYANPSASKVSAAPIAAATPSKNIQEGTTSQNLPVVNSPAGYINGTVSDVSGGSPEQLIKPVVKPKPNRVFTVGHQSKFRHLKGSVPHRDTHIENIRNLSRSVPGESDFFVVNQDRAAVPIGGSGGLIAILELSQPGRLPDTGVPALQNGSMVMDFTWDPFDNARLAVACDDAKVKLWRIPDGGLTDPLYTEPEAQLKGHTEKIYFVRFHPLARDVVATGSYDLTVRIWDLTTGVEMIQLEAHTDTIFCLSWSPDGKKLATVCKDGKIRVYEPRKSTTPISEGPGPEGSRGARIAWVCGGRFLAVSGFNRISTRVVRLYDPSDLSAMLANEDLDTAPAILVPFYDEDSSTLFLTGRGDSTAYTFEVVEDTPYFYPLSPYKATSLHQALAFLPKIACDVKGVEFAKGYRVTQTTIEPLSFTMPRIKMEFFQDDLYPDTKVTWEPVLTSEEWFSGVTRLPETVSLKPAGMTALSDAPVRAPKPKKYESQKELTMKTVEQKKEELVTAMVNKLDTHDEPLPQDLTQGVDEDEWDD